MKREHVDLCRLLLDPGSCLGMIRSGEIEIRSRESVHCVAQYYFTWKPHDPLQLCNTYSNLATDIVEHVCQAEYSTKQCLRAILRHAHNVQSVPTVKSGTCTCIEIFPRAVHMHWNTSTHSTHVLKYLRAQSRAAVTSDITDPWLKCKDTYEWHHEPRVTSEDTHVQRYLWAWHHEPWSTSQNIIAVKMCNNTLPESKQYPDETRGFKRQSGTHWERKDGDRITVVHSDPWNGMHVEKAKPNSRLLLPDLPHWWHQECIAWHWYHHCYPKILMCQKCVTTPSPNPSSIGTKLKDSKDVCDTWKEQAHQECKILCQSIIPWSAKLIIPSTEAMDWSWWQEATQKSKGGWLEILRDRNSGECLRWGGKCF